MAQAEHGNADSPQGRGIDRVDPKGGGISNLQPPYHETNLCKGDGQLDCSCGWPPFFFFFVFCLFFMPAARRPGCAGRAVFGHGSTRRPWRVHRLVPLPSQAARRHGKCPRRPRGPVRPRGPMGRGSSGRRPRQDSCRIAAGRSWPPAAGGHPPAGKPSRFDRWTACTAINAAASPARIAPPGAACGNSAAHAKADTGLWRGPR